MLNLLKLVTYCDYVKKIPALWKYTQKYLRIKGHDEYNLPSNGRERKREDGGRGESEREREYYEPNGIEHYQ